MTIRPKAHCAFCGRRIYDLTSLERRQYCKGKPCEKLHQEFIAKHKKKNYERTI